MLKSSINSAKRARCGIVIFSFSECQLSPSTNRFIALIGSVYTFLSEVANAFEPHVALEFAPHLNSATFHYHSNKTLKTHTRSHTQIPHANTHKTQYRRTSSASGRSRLARTTVSSSEEDDPSCLLLAPLPRLFCCEEEAFFSRFSAFLRAFSARRSSFA